MAAAVDFKSRPGMLSGPQALFGSRFTRTASTSATDRWISDKADRQDRSVDIQWV